MWSDETKTSYKKMPILKDLYDVIGEKIKTEPTLKSIYNTMKYFVSGSGASFNGQTNVNLQSEFTVFGLEHLTDESIALGVFLTMDYCWSKIKQDSIKRKALFIDEWWKMAINPIAATYSLEISKVIRAYNGAMVLATQQMTDILLVDDGKFGTAVLNNCAIKILMKMTENDASKVKQIMLLTNDETDKISHSKKGEAMFVYGTDKIQMKFVATETEDRLITTDSKQLSQIAKENEENEKTAYIKSKIKNAKDITNRLITAKQFCLENDVILLDSYNLVGFNIDSVPTLLNSNQYEMKGEK